MSRSITVPRQVVLPCGAVIAPMEAYARLGISRQTGSTWRRHGFPPSGRDGINTAALAAWLVQRGALIEWI